MQIKRAEQSSMSEEQPLKDGRLGRMRKVYSSDLLGIEEVIGGHRQNGVRIEIRMENSLTLTGMCFGKERRGLGY